MTLSHKVRSTHNTRPQAIALIALTSTVDHSFRQRLLLGLGACLLAAVLVSAAQADTLSMPAAGTGNDVTPIGQQGHHNLNRPRSGMRKSEVSRVYGQPLSKTAAVGQPPISSWAYKSYTVYFEYDHVIHSVLKTVQWHKKPTVKGELVRYDRARFQIEFVFRDAKQYTGLMDCQPCKKIAAVYREFSDYEAIAALF